MVCSHCSSNSIWISRHCKITRNKNNRKTWHKINQKEINQPRVLNQHSCLRKSLTACSPRPGNQLGLTFIWAKINWQVGSYPFLGSIQNTSFTPKNGYNTNATSKDRTQPTPGKWPPTHHLRPSSQTWLTYYMGSSNMVQWISISFSFHQQHLLFVPHIHSIHGNPWWSNSVLNRGRGGRSRVRGLMSLIPSSAEL